MGAPNRLRSRLAQVLGARHVQKALADVQTLSGLLPICAWCKKVRDDDGYWTRIESYISERSKAEFTHGICPDCDKKLEVEELEPPV